MPARKRKAAIRGKAKAGKKQSRAARQRGPAKRQARRPAGARKKQVKQVGASPARGKSEEE